MATGYTAAVQDGKATTLRQYALVCARAFGALASMRDESFDAPVPTQLATDTKHHDERIAEANATLADVGALDTQQAEIRAEADFRKELAAFTERQTERATQKLRYQSMLAKVEAWKVSDDLGTLRDFMLRQLRESMEFDCGEPRFSDRPVRLTAEEWRKRELKHASHSLSYHQIERTKSAERTAKANDWLTTLWSSLPAAE